MFGSGVLDNDTMDRVSGWYKRKVQLIIIGLALVITLTLNDEFSATPAIDRLVASSATRVGYPPVSLDGWRNSMVAYVPRLLSPSVRRSGSMYSTNSCHSGLLASPLYRLMVALPKE